MSSKKSILLLYVSTIHRGHIDLLKKYAGEVERLYILGSDIIADFPLIIREIHSISAEIAAKMLEATKIIPQVEVVTKANLGALNCYRIVTTTEDLMENLCQSYFPEAEVHYDSSIFLRFDKKSVQQASGGAFTAQYPKTQSELYRRTMREVEELASRKSADWFRQVGCAAIVSGDRVILPSYNIRMPTVHDALTYGDPRNYITYEEDRHISRVLHAEQSLINEAARRGISLQGACVVVTCYPCFNCAMSLVTAGIKKIVFKDGSQALIQAQDPQPLFSHFGVEVEQLV